MMTAQDPNGTAEPAAEVIEPKAPAKTAAPKVATKAPKAPAATEAKPAAANDVATAPEAAPDNTNENLGCGCAEPCHATN